MISGRPLVRAMVMLVVAASGCGPAAPPAHDPDHLHGPAPEPPPTAALDADPEPHAHAGEAHGHDAPPAPQPTADPQAAALAAFERAKPVFEKHCVRCHRPGELGAKLATLEHLEMSGYPFKGHHAHEITKLIRASLGVGGTKATMPKDKPGAVQGDELALIVAWADAADRVAPADDHGHSHGHAH